MTLNFEHVELELKLRQLNLKFELHWIWKYYYSISNSVGTFNHDLQSNLWYYRINQLIPTLNIFILQENGRKLDLFVVQYCASVVVLHVHQLPYVQCSGVASLRQVREALEVVLASSIIFDARHVTLELLL